MSVSLQLPKYTEEEALGLILAYLRRPTSSSPFSAKQYGYDLYIPDVMSGPISEMQAEWRRQHPNAGMVSFETDTRVNSEPFYDAAWSLCTRGILRPAILYSRPPMNQPPVLGAGYNLTPYGKEWLSQTSGYESIPSEYGRFAQLLAERSNRFGNGYHVRSQEAVNCYRAHTYLACCVMCGGAAESILLKLAIVKMGDEEQVLQEYMKNRGRTTIENKLLAHANSHIQQELRNYTDLLKYWRDAAAHGANTSISEGEAFTSLLLLLRFAQFAGDRWDEITKRPES